MKKLLLSMALVAAVSVSAETYTYEFANATDIVGTETPERPAGTNGDTDNGEGAKWQPLQSLKLGDFSFTFAKGDASTEPALYFPMSTATSGVAQVRLYGKGSKTETGNTMTIKAPEGVTFGKIEFKGTNGKTTMTINASVGACSDYGTSGYVWQSSTPVNEVTITQVNQQFRYSSLTISTEAGEDPQPTEKILFEKASSMESGSYIFVVDGKIACPIAENKTYGYMYFDVTATMEGDKIVYNTEDAMTVDVDADGKVTLKDPYGRYYGMDATHFSFQVYDALQEGCYWTAEFVDGNVKLTNTYRTDCFVAQFGTYNNLAPNKTDTYVLPAAYKYVAAGIENVAAETVDANAPVVYYNIQGQRVMNPAQGLYIRVQGNKAEKVVIR